MTKNNKPILSILIDDDKRVKFAALARRNSLSMSYLVNQAIDRMLEADSIDSSIVTSVGTSAGTSIDSSVGGMIQTIEELVKSSIESMNIEELVKSYVDTHKTSIEPTDIEKLVKSYVDTHSFSIGTMDEVKRLIVASSNELLELIPSDIPTLETIKAEIEHSIAPIENSIVELETYTRSQLATMRDELKKPLLIANPVQNLTKPDIDDVRETEAINSSQNINGDAPSDRLTADTIANPTTTKLGKTPNKKTWVEFFEMVGIKAMTATEAQKKQDTDTRTQQIERGIQAAKDKGLGEWAVNKAGRSFVQVDAS